MNPKRALRQLTLANQLTFLRLVAVPFFVIAVLERRFGIALAIFVGAALTDALDGLTARWFDQGTRLGAYLDPAADKLLLTAGFVLLTDFPRMFQQIPMVARFPLWLTVLTLFRDLLILAIALMLFLAEKQTRFKPSIWGKLNTLSMSTAVGIFLLSNLVETRTIFNDVAVWTTLILTLVSGFHYLGRTVGMLVSTSDARCEVADDRR